MKIDNYTAVGLAEGFIEAESEEQIIEAWQYLHDTGLAYQLQGWFGRTARDLIEDGVIDDNKAQVRWDVAKDHPHDISGIPNPEEYLYKKENGIYYPQSQ